jgi:hypothetical protein
VEIEYIQAEILAMAASLMSENVLKGFTQLDLSTQILGLKLITSPPHRAIQNELLKELESKLPNKDLK